MSNRSSNSKKVVREEKPRRSWQQIIFIGISVILIVAWVLSLIRI
jgi:predicted nucleic acid-binding Zn ribbon protein